MLLSEEFLITGIQDIILLIRHETIVGLIVLDGLVNELLKLIELILNNRCSGGGRGRGRLVDAGGWGLLVQLGKDHLATLRRDGRLRRDFLLGDGLLHIDIAPQSVAELVPVGTGKTPVRDGVARLAGGSHQDGEASLLARSHLGVASRALRSRHQLVDAGWMRRINSTHVVPPHEFDGTSSGPGAVAAVAKVPSLLEDSVGWEDRAVGNDIADEVSDEILRDGGSWKLLHFFLGGLLSVDDGGHLDLQGLSWLEIGDGLDLSGSVRRSSTHRLSGLRCGTVAATIAHDGHTLTILMITQSRDADISDGGLKLDERVGSVVKVGWASLAIGTEVGVVADCALESVTLDGVVFSISGVAEGSIAVNAVVASRFRSVRQGNVFERLVNGNESMTRVHEPGIWVASGAEVPVWAVEALVANTIDVLERC